jgi:hypothetical protein
MTLWLSSYVEVLMTPKPHDLSDLYLAPVTHHGHTFVLGIPAVFVEYLEDSPRA